MRRWNNKGVKATRSEYEIKVIGTQANWSFRTIAKAGGELLVFQTKHDDELSQHGIEDAPVAEDDQVG